MKIRLSFQGTPNVLYYTDKNRLDTVCNIKNFLKAIFGWLFLIVFPFGHASAVYDAETDKLIYRQNE